ncbi:UNVERIFIED_CONTAM: hypothetical protein FKN15_064709 [Acipenser sinensis]
MSRLCHLKVALSPCSNDDWAQTQAQEEEVAITEEDLELIKERETAIRQLEVQGSTDCLSELGLSHIPNHAPKGTPNVTIRIQYLSFK